MGDQGNLAQSAIGGYELATGSKPTLHMIHCTGKWTNGDALFINDEGTVTANSGSTSGFSVVHGAGSIVLGTVASGKTPLTVVFGSGDNKDDLDIIGAYGSISWDDGAATTMDTPGTLSVLSIAGGTVNCAVSMHGADGEAGPPVSGTDGYRLIIYAHARSNL